MESSRPFQFSLANLLLAMFSLAIMCGGVMLCVSTPDWGGNGTVAAVIGIMGVAAAIGALINGGKGLSWGLATTVFTMIVLPVFLTAFVFVTWAIVFAVSSTIVGHG